MVGARAYPCPCCGYLTMGGPASYDICLVCLWEDDPVQLRWPDWPGGGNHPSLVEAQEAYATTGACSSGALPFVRPATGDVPREPGWRRIDRDLDDFEERSHQQAPWPDDLTLLYWWRPTFWRARRLG